MKFLARCGVVRTVVVGVLGLVGAVGAHADGVIGPVFGPSPFDALTFSSFQLIRMTDLPVGFVGPTLVPGVGLTGAAPQILPPGSLIDSADGGNAGQSLFSGCGACGFTFTFDAAVLGSLPTAAGIVWTDGDFDIHFSAIDANGNSIGAIDDNSGCDFDSCGDGKPSNYRFYGATDALGIKSITISNDAGGIEVDHLQFGVLAPTSSVPEPGSFFLLGSALVGLTGWVKRTVSDGGKGSHGAEAS